MALPALNSSIIATLVPEVEPCVERLQFLPKYLGRKHMQLGEQLVYDWMSRLCTVYRGAFWHFYTLSNGGCYLAPKMEGDMHIEWADNFTDVMLSPDAAGIVASIFAFGHLTEITGEERHMNLFHWLREYACEHPEAKKILNAID